MSGNGNVAISRQDGTSGMIHIRERYICILHDQAKIDVPTDHGLSDHRYFWASMFGPYIKLWSSHF